MSLRLIQGCWFISKHGDEYLSSSVTNVLFWGVPTRDRANHKKLNRLKPGPCRLLQFATHITSNANASECFLFFLVQERERDFGTVLRQIEPSLLAQLAEPDHTCNCGVCHGRSGVMVLLFETIEETTNTIVSYSHLFSFKFA